MTTAVAAEVAREPIQALIDELWSSERRHAEEQESSLNALEDAMSVLQEWSDRLEKQEAEQAVALDEIEAELKEELETAEEVRSRLDKELKAARDRIAELEASLQSRTEELLEAQSANHDLSAEIRTLQEAATAVAPAPVVDPPPEAEREDTSPSEKPRSAAASYVSERFQRLRQQRTGE